MPRNASGTYTLPAGNPVVTGTVIASTWANTTLDDLKTEVTDSLSRSAKGGMLGALALVDGTAALPALSFNNELSTGMYRAVANELDFAVAGVGRLALRTVSAAMSHFSPLAAGDVGADILFDTSVTRTGGNLFILRTGGASRLRVSAGGDLVLGNSGAILATDTANLSLVLVGNRLAADGSADVVARSAVTRTAGSLFTVQNVGTAHLRVDFDGSLVSTSAASGTLIFDTAGQVRTNAANATLTLRGNKSAADSGTDVLVTSTATRTAGYLFQVQNAGTLTGGLSFNGQLDLNGTAQGVVAAATNSSLTLHGNRSAADAGTDLILRSQTTRTAGLLLEVRNNATTKFNVNFNGTATAAVDLIAAAGWVYSNATAPKFTSSGSNVSVTVEGRRDAADAGADVILNGTSTRTAGKLLSVQNNTAEKASVDFNGVLASATAADTVTAGTGWTLDVARVNKSAGLVTAHFTATAGATSAFSSIGTLSAGFRPLQVLSVMGNVLDVSASLTFPCEFRISTVGVVSLFIYDNGTSLVAPFAIGTGDVVRFTCDFAVA